MRVFFSADGERGERMRRLWQAVQASEATVGDVVRLMIAFPQKRVSQRFEAYFYEHLNDKNED